MANETKQPAAPPDPLQEEVEAAAAQFLIALAFIVERGTDVNAALGSHLDRYRRAIFATERQHHAAQLAEKDAEIGTLQALSSEREFIERERADCATDQLTAARAEIARLTEDAICATEQQNAAVLRAEAAEASLLALQQQIAEKDVHLALVRDTANGWQANYAEKDAELLALRTAHAQLRDMVGAAWENTAEEQTEIRLGEALDILTALAAAPPHPETQE